MMNESHEFTTENLTNELVLWNSGKNASEEDKDLEWCRISDLFGVKTMSDLSQHNTCAILLMQILAVVNLINNYV